MKELLLMNEGSKDEAALDYLKKMVQKSPFRGKVFLAGGAVRDLEMGTVPKDLDVVVVDFGVNGGMDFAVWLAKEMGNYKESSNPVLFPKFGTAKVVLNGEHNGVSLNGMDVEAVFARKEVYTPGSRKPVVSPGTLKDDVFRRDATVNSLMLDLSTGEVLDLTGHGKEDIKNGYLRTPSNPDEIFGQDALRIFRFIRFSTKYGWKLAPEVIEGIKNNLGNLGNTSRERIRDEINKILLTGNPRRGFELMRDTGLLPYVAPEFQQAVGMIQNAHHHEDVFSHTMTVLSKTNPDLITRLMAVFHDIGKVVTRSETPTGVHFYGHEDQTDVVDRIMKSLKYPTELIDAVKLGVRNHMRLKQGGDDAVKLSDKTLRKFKIELGDQLERVLDLIHADNISHADASNMPNQIDIIRKRLATLDVKVGKPALPINGNDIQIELGVSKGPLIGKMLSAVTDAWYSNPNITRDEAMTIAKSMI
jgi:poly(A) polymerase